jgi:hypothetical protein
MPLPRQDAPGPYSAVLAAAAGPKWANSRSRKQITLDLGRAARQERSQRARGATPVALCNPAAANPFAHPHR